MKLRFLALALTLAFVAALFCACAKNETQVIDLGTSGFTVTVDASYKKGNITADDTSEGQVAYYYSDDSLLDFDIYQWVLAEGETLAGSADAEAKEYDAEASEKTFGNIKVFYYGAKEESEGKEYDTATYMMENKGTIAEIVFWLDGKNASAQAENIMKTLVIKSDPEKSSSADANEIKLGTSTLHITPAKAYKAGEISAEDTNENQVGYFYSDETTVDFDVYMWAKATDETLASAVAEEAAEYEAEVKEATYNGISVMYYNAEEESDGTTYNTVTYIAEDGDYFVEIVIWLDGETADAEAAQIIGSLSR